MKFDILFLNIWLELLIFTTVAYFYAHFPIILNSDCGLQMG